MRKCEGTREREKPFTNVRFLRKYARALKLLFAVFLQQDRKSPSRNLAVAVGVGFHELSFDSLDSFDFVVFRARSSGVIELFPFVEIDERVAVGVELRKRSVEREFFLTRFRRRGLFGAFWAATFTAFSAVVTVDDPCIVALVPIGAVDAVVLISRLDVVTVYHDPQKVAIEEGTSRVDFGLGAR